MKRERAKQHTSPILLCKRPEFWRTGYETTSESDPSKNNENVNTKSSQKWNEVLPFDWTNEWYVCVSATIQLSEINYEVRSFLRFGSFGCCFC